MNVSPASNHLLIEFLCEELPPINLESDIGIPFSQAIFDELSGFHSKDSNFTYFIAPRRFGLIIHGINFSEADKTLRRKGPAISTGLADGEPTKALQGFAKSCGCTWQQLEQASDGYFYYTALVKGRQLNEVIDQVLQQGLKKIQIAKAMRWGDSEVQFVRPVHNLVVLFNNAVVNCNALGLSASDTTQGHRFMCHEPVKIAHASEYLTQMRLQGKVIAHFSERKELISKELASKASELGLVISPSDELLDEVTALNEWPEVLIGEFPARFLSVPQECLILSMAKNQKYFALLDSHGKLSNKFLFVANLASKQPQVIIEGNQKVLTARLTDAEFFYEFYKRTPLAKLLPKLQEVVYHNKLGTQMERTHRLSVIAQAFAPLLLVDPKLAAKAATLLKVDLVTEMVGEFPELQGIMGKYYALASHEPQEVAEAIEQHYYPRFSGDSLPHSQLAKVMALADRLETLVGIWGIDLIPTGDKDPYALRRAALGVVRLLLSDDLDLKQLLMITAAAFKPGQLAPTTVGEVYEFIVQRLANYLTLVENLPTKVVAAAITAEKLTFASEDPKSFSYLPSLLATINGFANDEANQSLFQANKRIENILKKNEGALTSATLNPKLISSGAEANLYQRYHSLLASDKLTEASAANDWHSYFNYLAQFNQPLDNFFNDVMVMDNDPAIRNNRLNLLAKLHAAFNQVVKLAELV
jgi:glycyl-tRNA synthetase beta chain